MTRRTRASAHTNENDARASRRSARPRSSQPEEIVDSGDDINLDDDALNLIATSNPSGTPHQLKFADETTVRAQDLASAKQKHNVMIGMATIASLVLISTSAMFGVYVPPFVLMALHGENVANDAMFAVSRNDAEEFAEGTKLNASSRSSNSSAKKSGGIGGSIGGAAFFTGVIWAFCCCGGCCECCGIYGCCGPYAQINANLSHPITRSCCKTSNATSTWIGCGCGVPTAAEIATGGVTGAVSSITGANACCGR